MKKIALILIVTVVLIAIIFASDDENMQGEMTSIKQVTLDYIEGWYEGNVNRMRKALHPELLVKTGIVIRPDTERIEVHRVDAKMMFDMTSKGGGKNYPEEKKKNEIMILDVYKNTATVKAVSAQYVDYLHLAKLNGRWKIVNILWEFKK